MDLPMSALFVAACNCGLRQGVQGKAVHHFDGPDGLHIVLNGTHERAEHLDPVHMAIFANKGDAFPVAVINPYQGGVVRNPKWTEDQMIAALDAQVEAKRGIQKAASEETSS